MTGLPRFNTISADRVSLHATAVALHDKGIALCGPSGAGKSGLAAQLITLGARLVSDDLCLITRTSEGLSLERPAEAPAAMELRGLGLVTPPSQPQAPLTAFVRLEPSPARLPEPEIVDVLGHGVPILRHPYRFDTAAKLWLWFA